jgi:hypothetical protein
MAQIKLTVNVEKTRVCQLPDETFEFLGYTFGRCYSPGTGRACLGTRPSKRSVRRVVQRKASRSHGSVSATSSIRIPETFCIFQPCHSAHE